MKILISDIDKTFYFSGVEKRISDEDIQAIKAFQSQGNLFGVCTGRSMSGMQNILKNYDVHLDFMVLSSGAIIINNKGEYIKNVTISNEHVISLLESIKQYPINYSLTKDTNFYYKNDTLDKQGDTVFRLHSLEDIKESFYHSLAIQFDDHQTIIEVANYLRNNFEVEVNQNELSLDVSPKGCDKGTGIHQLVEYLGVDESNVYGIGDSYNDLPMFKAVHYSFTFQRSPDEVKKKANELINSLAEAIDRLLKE